jgi:photosystem II stability/assembly factor-like uncharacterized protein
MPTAAAGEGVFAASNSSLVPGANGDAWIGSGAARIYHLRGSTVTVVPTPIRSDRPSAGIFSIAFNGGRRGIAVGGDYAKPAETKDNIAVTTDGGATWSAPGTGPAGFRSAVVYVPSHNAWIATGTTGSDISRDDGRTWKTFDTGNYNALGFAGDEGWAVGPNGRIARFELK